MNRAQMIMARFDLAEYRLCRELNRGSHLAAVRVLFQAASRLGDGIVWYMLIAALPLPTDVRAQGRRWSWRSRG